MQTFSLSNGLVSQKGKIVTSQNFNSQVAPVKRFTVLIAQLKLHESGKKINFQESEKQEK